MRHDPDSTSTRRQLKTPGGSGRPRSLLVFRKLDSARPRTGDTHDPASGSPMWRVSRGGGGDGPVADRCPRVACPRDRELAPGRDARAPPTKWCALKVMRSDRSGVGARRRRGDRPVPDHPGGILMGIDRSTGGSAIAAIVASSCTSDGCSCFRSRSATSHTGPAASSRLRAPRRWSGTEAEAPPPATLRARAHPRVRGGVHLGGGGSRGGAVLPRRPTRLRGTAVVA